MSGVGRQSCEDCKSLYKEYEEAGMFSLCGDGPPCATCKPELKPTNVPFFILYEYCQDQVIMGPAGAVSLDGGFLNAAMEDYQVDKDERILFSRKCRRIAGIILSHHYKESERKRKAAAKKK